LKAIEGVVDDRSIELCKGKKFHTLCSSVSGVDELNEYLTDISEIENEV